MAPEGAEPVDVEEELYDRLSAAGFSYGPAFTGIRAAWRRGEELFAEVALERSDAEEAARFQIHPALFDAALQGVVAILQEGEEESAPGRGAMLFSWNGVRRYASGVSALRVRVTAAGGSALSMAALDEHGAPVASVDSLAIRRVDAQQLAGAGRRAHDSLFALEWMEAERRPGAGTEARGHSPPASIPVSASGSWRLASSTLPASRSAMRICGGWVRRWRAGRRFRCGARRGADRRWRA